LVYCILGTSCGVSLILNFDCGELLCSVDQMARSYNSQLVHYKSLSTVFLQVYNVHGECVQVQCISSFSSLAASSVPALQRSHAHGLLLRPMDRIRRVSGCYILYDQVRAAPVEKCRKRLELIWDAAWNSRRLSNVSMHLMLGICTSS
jgi:hypothetical protein